jgi:hypothetical protein
MAETLPFASELAPPTGLTDDLGVLVDQTEAGGTRLRSVYSSAFTDMELRWNLMSLADTETLRAWFRTHRLADVTFALGGRTYEGKIVANPQFRYVSPQWRAVTVSVRVEDVTT